VVAQEVHWLREEQRSCCLSRVGDGVNDLTENCEVDAVQSGGEADQEVGRNCSGNQQEQNEGDPLNPARLARVRMHREHADQGKTSAHPGDIHRKHAKQPDCDRNQSDGRW
jgi:hypothetical protein